MEKTAEGTNQVTEIEPPDLDNLEPWLDKHVKQYFKGFEDKRRPDGTPYGEAELIGESKQQLRLAANGFRKIGMSDAEIKKELMAAVMPYSEAPSK